MRNYDREEIRKRDIPMREVDFETLLEECIPELPPAYVVDGVTPWKTAMNRILWGMALTTITLNFWLLDYILPMIGQFLMLFGFRMLREENAWFKKCWYLTIFRMVNFVIRCILHATIFRSMLADSYAEGVITIVSLAIIFIQIFFFRKAIRMVQKKAGLQPKANAMLVLLGWYGVLCSMSAVQYAGLLVIVLLIGYIFIIRSLYKISKELTEAGYVIENAPIRVSEGKIIAGALGILLVGISCGYLFFHSYPMDWKPAVATEDAKRKEIENHLIEIGFPQKILADLSEDDVKACEGALRVVVQVEMYPVNEGKIVIDRSEGGRYTHTVYDKEELRFTNIAVELPGERERWKVFHHFEFTIPLVFYGTESIQLWSCYRNDSYAWAADGEVTGQVLYDMDGQTYIAPYASLKEETYQNNSILFADTTRSTDVFAEFSMPEEGERHRGYLSYTTAEVKDGVMLRSWVNYTHQTSWLQYPVLSAKEKRMQNDMVNRRPFKTVQDSISFYPFR